MTMRRRQLLRVAAEVVPSLLVMSWLATRFLAAGVERAAVPALVRGSRALLGKLRIVVLDEERIGPADDLAG